MQCLSMYRAAFENKRSQPQDLQTGAFRPNDANRKCPWKDGPYSSIDPFTPETVAGKPGFRSISLLEHVCDPCIFQEKMRHLESTWS